MATKKKQDPLHVLARQFGSSATKGVRIIGKEPQNWWALGPCSLGVEAWCHQKQPRPHMCYHVKFGGSATKGVRMNRKEPPKLWSARTRLWGGRVADLPKHATHHLCYRVKFGSSALHKYTVFHKKKQPDTLLPITSANVDRFSKFFHCQTQQ